MSQAFDVPPSARRDVQRPAGAPVVVAALRPGLGPLEVGQQVSVGPFGQRVARPAVVVERIAADIDLAIDGGRSAEHATAWAMHDATAEVRFRFSEIIPAVAFTVHGLGKGSRHSNLPFPEWIFTAGFQQQHADRRILGQAVCQYATCGTGTDNHIVCMQYFIVHGFGAYLSNCAAGRGGRFYSERARGCYDQLTTLTLAGSAIKAAVRTSGQGVKLHTELPQ